jgi:hypothetical protein
MEPSALYWSILNRNDLRQVNGLTYSQARFIVSLIEKNSYSAWLVWHEGLPKWTPLKDFKELYAPSSSETMQLPPTPPSQIDEDEVVLNSKPSNIDKRMNRRILKNFKVEISDPRGVQFETRTTNVSTGGMALEKGVPEDFGKSFQCKISRADGSSILAYCSLAKESGERNRLKFMEVAQIRILMSWLIDSAIE